MKSLAAWLALLPRDEIDWDMPLGEIDGIPVSPSNLFQFEAKFSMASLAHSPQRLLKDRIQKWLSHLPEDKVWHFLSKDRPTVTKQEVLQGIERGDEIGQMFLEQEDKYLIYLVSLADRP